MALDSGANAEIHPMGWPAARTLLSGGLGLALLALAPLGARAASFDEAESARAAAGLRALLQEAERSYRAFEHAGALERLGRAQQALPWACPALTQELAREPWRLEGLVRFSAGERAGAVIAFGRAASADPEFTPDAREWSPKLLAAYAEAQERVRAAAPARLRLRDLAAGASLRLDGRELGAPPEELELVAGDHCLVLRAEGHRPRAIWARLAAGEPLELALPLEPSQPDKGPTPVEPVLATEPPLGSSPSQVVLPDSLPEPLPVDRPEASPAWYQRWWVWTLVGVAVLGGLAAGLGVGLAAGDGGGGLEVVVTRPPR